MVGLLDLTTRGTMMPSPWDSTDPTIHLSDPDAYLDEDLAAAELLRLNLTLPTNQSGLKSVDCLSLRAKSAFGTAATGTQTALG